MTGNALIELLAVVAGLVAVTALAAVQLRHRRMIARDPARELLADCPAGEAVQVRSADGTRLHVEVFGDESQPTIVLIHGWTEAVRVWNHQIRDLAADYRIVAYDQRGHGRSGLSAGGDYSLRRLGEDLEAVLTECVPAGARPLLVGHSMGAMTVAAWAQDRDVDSRICGAALVNTGVSRILDDSLLLARWPMLDRYLHDFVGRRLIAGNALPVPRPSTPIHHALVRWLAFGPTASPASVEFLTRMAMETNVMARMRFAQAMAGMDLLGALGSIDVPTVMVAGERDQLTPPIHARRMADGVAGPSTLRVIPNAGHLGQLEFPAVYNALIRRFADEVGHLPAVALAA